MMMIHAYLFLKIHFVSVLWLYMRIFVYMRVYVYICVYVCVCVFVCVCVCIGIFIFMLYIVMHSETCIMWPLSRKTTWILRPSISEQIVLIIYRMNLEIKTTYPTIVNYFNRNGLTFQKEASIILVFRQSWSLLRLSDFIDTWLSHRIQHGHIWTHFTIWNSK